VERDGLVKGYEFAKDQYVKVSDQELEALEDLLSRPRQGWREGLSAVSGRHDSSR
jgi:hypothetical protein